VAPFSEGEGTRLETIIVRVAASDRGAGFNTFALISRVRASSTATWFNGSLLPDSFIASVDAKAQAAFAATFTC
jgi:hypothetical protein